MGDPCIGITNATHDACGQDSAASGIDETSRRAFLTASAGILAAAVAPMQSDPARAQGATAADSELARVLAERRLLIKGGVVLSLDLAVGDFAQATC